MNFKKLLPRLVWRHAIYLMLTFLLYQLIVSKSVVDHVRRHSDKVIVDIVTKYLGTDRIKELIDRNTYKMVCAMVVDEKKENFKDISRCENQELIIYRVKYQEKPFKVIKKN